MTRFSPVWFRACVAAAWLVAGCFALPAATGPRTTRLEAEDAEFEGPTLAVMPVVSSTAILMGNGRQEPYSRSGYSGTGYVTGFVTNSDKLMFQVKAPAGAGVYDLHIGHVSEGRKGYALRVNGLKVSGMFNSTRGRGFSDQSVGRIELDEGANTIVIERGWGYFDIDYIEISPSTPIAPPVKPFATPSDPHATAAVQGLLARLIGVYGKGTMLGVYDDQDAQYVADTTGFRPTIMGGDLSHFSPAFLEHEAKPGGETERLVARAAEGYVVTLSWHWISPSGLIDAMLPDAKGGPAVDARWYKGFYTNATTFDVAAAMADSASKERALLLRDIDAIAVQLKKLDAVGVPVLWRPLHEAEGGWFWWGAKGPKPFIALWRLMYDRLVNVDGVHNLVWVYTSGGDPAWYPGDDVVDVVGIDAYPEDLRDPQTALWEELERQFGGRKLLAISEYGGVPDVERMQRLGADWAYAVSWSGDLGPRKNGAEDLRHIYAVEVALKMPLAEPEASAAPASAATGRIK